MYLGILRNSSFILTNIFHILLVTQVEEPCQQVLAAMSDKRPMTQT